MPYRASRKIALYGVAGVLVLFGGPLVLGIAYAIHLARAS
jgi:hypothetical protein